MHGDGPHWAFLSGSGFLSHKLDASFQDMTEYNVSFVMSNSSHTKAQRRVSCAISSRELLWRFPHHGPVLLSRHRLPATAFRHGRGIQRCSSTPSQLLGVAGEQLSQPLSWQLQQSWWKPQLSSSPPGYHLWRHYRDKDNGLTACSALLLFSLQKGLPSLPSLPGIERHAPVCGNDILLVRSVPNTSQLLK